MADSRCSPRKILVNNRTPSVNRVTVFSDLAKKNYKSEITEKVRRGSISINSCEKVKGKPLCVS